MLTLTAAIAKTQHNSYQLKDSFLFMSLFNLVAAFDTVNHARLLDWKSG